MHVNRFNTREDGVCPDPVLSIAVEDSGSLTVQGSTQGSTANRDLLRYFSYRSFVYIRARIPDREFGHRTQICSTPHRTKGHGTVGGVEGR